MKTSATNLRLWVDTNRKAMTPEQFTEKTGMDFFDFSATYKSQTKKAWSEYTTTKDNAPTMPNQRNLERENHLLRIIEVWKGRYKQLKASVTKFS